VDTLEEWPIAAQEFGGLIRGRWLSNRFSRGD
jgi:hypothetical protein